MRWNNVWYTKKKMKCACLFVMFLLWVVSVVLAVETWKRALVSFGDCCVRYHTVIRYDGYRKTWCIKCGASRNKRSVHESCVVFLWDAWMPRGHLPLDIKVLFGRDLFVCQKAKCFVFCHLAMSKRYQTNKTSAIRIRRHLALGTPAWKWEPPRRG